MGIRSEKTLQTKTELAEAFWQLYLEKPLNKITVNDIVERAGYYRSTFYYHFADVYAVLDYIEASILSDWEQTVTMNLKKHGKALMDGDLQGCIVDAMPFIEKHGAHIAVLFGTEGDPKMLRSIKETLRHKLFTMLEIPEDDLEASLVFEGVSSCSIATFVKCYNEKIPIEYAIHTLFKIANPQIFHIFWSHGKRMAH